MKLLLSLRGGGFPFTFELFLYFNRKCVKHKATSEEELTADSIPLSALIVLESCCCSNYLIFTDTNTVNSVLKDSTQNQ